MLFVLFFLAPLDWLLMTLIRLHRIHRPAFAACFTTGGAGLSFAKAGVQLCND